MATTPWANRAIPLRQLPPRGNVLPAYAHATAHASLRRAARLRDSGTLVRTRASVAGKARGLHGGEVGAQPGLLTLVELYAGDIGLGSGVVPTT